MAADVDLAELLSALSLATDLANHQPFEAALRTCLFSLKLGAELGVDGDARSELFYFALLRFMGCTAYSHEASDLVGGDDRAFHRTLALAATASRTEILRASLTELGRGEGPAQRLRTMSHAVLNRRTIHKALTQSQCEVATRFAERLHMPESVRVALEQIYERWDGEGLPRGLRGTEISLPTRIVQVARIAELSLRQREVDETARALQSRAGKALDPAVVETAFDQLPALAEYAGATSVWDELAALAPSRPATCTLEDVATAFGDFADLKSVYTLGHASSVAGLAEAAAQGLGLGPDDQRELGLAGLLHDLGTVALPTGILEKATKLSASEWDLVHLHPHHTARILGRSKSLARIASIAADHHERCDGSGYLKGVSASALPMTSRILAAADACQALSVRRPHRGQLDDAALARTLRAEAEAGRLDAAAVEAVLKAAGHAPAARRGRKPGELTPREIEVLRYVAQGLTEKEIATVLSLSPRTVHHHVTHVYAKLGVSTRAAAALSAVELGLLPTR